MRKLVQILLSVDFGKNDKRGKNNRNVNYWSVNGNLLDFWLFGAIKECGITTAAAVAAVS